MSPDTQCTNSTVLPPGRRPLSAATTLCALLAGLACGAGAGCSGPQTAPELSVAGGDATPEAAPDHEAEPDTDEVPSVRASPLADPICVGTEWEVVVELEPPVGYEFTHGFPFQIEVAGVGLASEQSWLLRARDAEVLSDQAVSWRVTGTASAAGEYPVVGEVRYSICNERTCLPGTLRFDWMIVGRDCDSLPQ